MSGTSQIQSFYSPAYVMGMDISMAVCSAFSLLLMAVPLYCHIRSGHFRHHLPMLTLIFWLSLSNLMTLVNALIWRSEDYSHWFSGYGLCDVEVYLVEPMFTGIACSLMVMAKDLAVAMRLRAVHHTKGQLKWRFRTNIVLLYSVPFLQLCLFYVVQSNRYYIIAVTGCSPAVDLNILTVMVLYVPAQIFAIAACCFCGEIVVRCYRCGLDIEVLSDSDSSTSMSSAKFLRLYLTAAVLTLLYLPMSSWLLATNIKAAYFDKYSYSRTHDLAEWSPIYYPFDGIFSLDRWCTVVASVSIFLFEGMSPGCIEVYRKLLVKMGMAKIWPSLREPQQRRGSDETGTSWMIKHSPIQNLKYYLERRAIERKSAQTGGSWIKKFNPMKYFKARQGPRAVQDRSISHEGSSQAHLTEEEPEEEGTELVTFDSLLEESCIAPVPAKPEPTYQTQICTGGGFERYTPSQSRLGLSSTEASRNMSSSSEVSRMEEGCSRVQVQRTFGVER